MGDEVNPFRAGLLSDELHERKQVLCRVLNAEWLRVRTERRRRAVVEAMNPDRPGTNGLVLLGIEIYTLISAYEQLVLVVRDESEHRAFELKELRRVMVADTHVRRTLVETVEGIVDGLVDPASTAG